jgi:hypothetical protein
MADGADTADAFSRLTAYARAWGVKPKMASAASEASLAFPEGRPGAKARPALIDRARPCGGARAARGGAGAAGIVRSALSTDRQQAARPRGRRRQVARAVRELVPSLRRAVHDRGDETAQAARSQPALSDALGVLVFASGARSRDQQAHHVARPRTLGWHARHGAIQDRRAVLLISGMAGGTRSDRHLRAGLRWLRLRSQGLGSTTHASKE